MQTNTRNRQGWGVAGVTLALLSLAIGTALGAVPSTTAYHFSSHPMISGTVVTVNDHQMVVDTDQREQVTLEIDSRTMAPRDLAPGMVMRAEFLALEDCRFYAQRVMAIRAGMSTDRFQAYAGPGESRERIAGNASVLGGYRPEGRETVPFSTGDGPIQRSMTAAPTTADYQFSTRPMMTGRVLSVNDHRLLVETDQGQRVGMVMDSRTMVPGEVEAGSLMRADFVQMKDGRYYAKRISRIGTDVVEREPAYAHTRDSDLALARNSADCGFVSMASPVTATVVESPVRTPGPVVAGPVAEVERPPTLPQTASRQPLLLLLGLLSLAGAGLLLVGRVRPIV